MPRKLRLAMENLAYCGGCELALSDLGQDLIDLLTDTIDLVYAPLFMSARDYDEVDVMFIIGAVRTEEDLELVKKARERAKYLVAFGACAFTGGIPGLANLYDTEKLFDTAYRYSPSNEEGEAVRPTKNVPGLIRQVKPLSEHVKVDFVLPGCPPSPPIIMDFLNNLLKEAKI